VDACREGYEIAGLHRFSIIEDTSDALGGLDKEIETQLPGRRDFLLIASRRKPVPGESEIPGRPSRLPRSGKHKSAISETDKKEERARRTKFYSVRWAGG